MTENRATIKNCRRIAIHDFCTTHLIRLAQGVVSGSKKRLNEIKRTPKIKDKKQSERFKEAARELGPHESSDAFERVVDEMARRKRPERDDK
jgi:hypothetical protein